MDERADSWVDVGAEHEITPDTPRVVRHGRQQLLVLRGGDGRLYALDNRCPHEGYPLAQGQVRGCTLTCAWHNFKFDLRDGRCLKGDEAVAVHPVRVHEGRVEVDPRVEADEHAVARGFARLREGMLDGRLGQVARDVVRLLDLQVPPERLAVEAAAFDAERAEYGCTHALPVAYDVLELLPRYPGPAAALPLMQAFELASESNVRRPPRRLAAPIDPGDDVVAAGERLRALVEDEQAEAAEALLRGALARGLGRAELEPWLYAPCCEHFLSFGHPYIYQTKIFALLDATGWEHAAVLLPAHLHGIVNATREDVLPRWQAFGRRMEAIDAQLPRWRMAVASGGTAAEMATDVRDACWRGLVEGGRDEAIDGVRDALETGHAPTAIADVIAAAGAARLLRFDLRHGTDPTLQEGWLDVTHTMTFAAAVHHGVQRYLHPRGLRPLFHAARFVHNAGALDGAGSTVGSVPRAGRSSVGAIERAIAARDPEAAVALTARYLADHGLDPALRRAAADLPLSDLYTRPIVVAHVIKVGRVAFELAGRLRGTAWADLPILAWVRFAAAPMHERSVARLVHEAERLVVAGKVPRSLT